jgi:hypothetical protein
MMPLVRIDLQKGKDAAYRKRIGRVVYEAMVGVGVPAKRSTALRAADAEAITGAMRTPIGR